MSVPSVFVLGDSISIHYGPFLEELLRGRFTYARKKGEQEALNSLDIPAGANGGDSEMVLRYLRTNNRHHEIPRGDMLLLNCGLHDIKTDPTTHQRHISEREYKQNLEGIIDQAKRLFKKIIWVRSTPVDDDRHNRLNKEFLRFNRDCKAYNIIADEVMQKNNVSIIDLYGFTKPLEPDPYIGHIHFNQEIRKKQALFIAASLRSLQEA